MYPKLLAAAAAACILPAATATAAVVFVEDFEDQSVVAGLDSYLEVGSKSNDGTDPQNNFFAPTGFNGSFFGEEDLFATAGSNSGPVAVTADLSNVQSIEVSFLYAIDSRFNSDPATFDGTFTFTPSVRIERQTGATPEFALTPLVVDTATTNATNTFLSYTASFAVPDAPLNPFNELQSVTLDVQSARGTGGRFVFIDDFTVSTTPIPEPASLAAVGLLAPLMLRRRR
jgi:hypothetical protein